ncbi:MAG: alkaline phosphatase PhoX [Thermodesulfobacteriota bacterium]
MARPDLHPLVASGRFSRRALLRGGLAVSLAFATLRRTAALAGPPAGGGLRPGPLRRDPNGLLDLPTGFSYRVVSRTGDAMGDGLRVPGAADGMGAFAGPDGKTIVVRNHELVIEQASLGPYGPANELLGKVPAGKLYDAGAAGVPAMGGTTTFVWDTRTGELAAQWLSLAGTVRNCAGGPTPWGSWISCEESVVTPGGAYAREHGWNFEVPASPTPGLVEPVPLKAMGRFYHEAVAFDPASGCVFQTEDLPDGLLYRFVPNDRTRLAAGGRLQAFKACDCKHGIDLRNWTSREAAIGELINAEWVDLDDVESPKDDLHRRGAALGATPFARGEGMWRGADGIYVACTSGGVARRGQIFRYVPSPYEGTPQEKDEPGTLELFVEPNDGERLDMGDNLTVAPWGEVIVCEDGSGEQFMRVVDLNGELHPLARNALNASELAGATFSPDGSTLFVNVYDPGITLAVTGPWPSAAV